MDTLPEPEVLSCFFHTGFEPHLAAMRLQWPAGAWQAREMRWRLPQCLYIMGPAPNQFGLSVHRQEFDSYAVSLLWNMTCLGWLGLPRHAIMGSSLAPLLAAIGTDLVYVLDQPVQYGPVPLTRSA